MSISLHNGNLQAAESEIVRTGDSFRIESDVSCLTTQRSSELFHISVK